MNKSMTGYGQARFENEQYAISAEIKSLNSKFLDVGIRLPKAFSNKELEVRNLLSDILERGKVNLVIEFLNKEESTTKVNINKSLFHKYYEILKTLSEEVGSKSDDIFRLSMQFPEVIETLEDDTNREKQWQMILPIIKEAILQCDEFRIKEGAVMTDSLKKSVLSIRENLEGIKALDPQRITRVKSRLNDNLKDFVAREELDVNRLEQELIYYIEKLDINEEIVRLGSHIEYFMEILENSQSTGKKMSFISQEMGREINTIGSKSNDAPMQKLVVNMKEELEKIKEQLLNLL
jgi:uncharacterized protein (TIGR00255 family)